jgi:hypothetical protein
MQDRDWTSAKKTVLFFKIDWRVTSIIDRQLASQLPLIQP